MTPDYPSFRSRGLGPRRLTAQVLTVALLVTAAGCSSVPPVHWVSNTAPDSSGNPDYAGSQEIEWTECRHEAAHALAGSPLPSSIVYECGTVLVPQDWNQPDNGETFEIVLLRARSEEQEDRIGSLLVNPGGPGGSGVDIAAYLSTTLSDEILRRFDIVGFDPRGVMRSSPLACIPDTLKDELIGFDPDPVSQDEFDEFVLLNEVAAQGCERTYGATLRLYSTEQTVRDMEAIRAALGDEKLTYLGYSYGTLLGAVYARLFPDRIRAFVLDGAVDPTVNGVIASERQAAGFELAFDNFVAWCRQVGRADCAIGPDARATVQGLLDRARQDPAVGYDGRQATAGWVLNLVISTLYTQDYWPWMAQALDDLDRGDPTLLFQIGDYFVGRDPNGTYDNSMEMLTNVNCVDDEESPTVEQVRQLQEEWRQEYPLFGAALAMSIVGCAVWPNLHDPYPVGEAEGAPPIVVIGTLGDPATPYEQAPALANLLGTGVLITYEGEGHTIYPDSPCVNEAVNQYLLELEPPVDGLRCPA